MSHFLRSQYHRVKWNGKTTGLSEPFWERPLSSELSVILTRRCHLQNGDFLGSCLLKGKNSVKRHRPVLSSKSFIEQKWKYTPETVWEGTVRKTEVAMQWSRAGFLEWCSLPMSCVIWLTSWLTALGYTTGLEYLCETHREAKTLMLIYYKCSIMKPSFVWVIRSWYTCIKLYWQVLSCLVQIRLET